MDNESPIKKSPSLDADPAPRSERIPSIDPDRGQRIAKGEDLAVNTESSIGEVLTTNQGLPVNDDQNSLKVGPRGPTLLEDFHLREKITHFDHERIPERVVHARGSAAHGFFQVYEPMTPLTRARFLQDPSTRTPVFVRFSTVAGSRGSSDLARDVRGFAVKFYTEEGVFDLVGNNIPVFFIQDAVKFPDLVHAVKPEPHHEMPQAASAHDTFWDFISLMPESLHMIMWVMSDRAIPRSFRMMEGFGVHTFRLVNAEGTSRFVKFHWKPLLGVHSVLWDEAQKISGLDPDFHRRDLWDSIESGMYPEYELGVQVVEESEQEALGIELLDPTKLIPEELVPVRRIGRLTLDRNPDNFFAETEQVAFHPGHVVPGIDFSDDPLLQGRLFSYLDTQLTRLGGPNFHEIPINRSIAPVHNLQRDGFMRQTINRGEHSYEPNTIGRGCPVQAHAVAGGFVTVPQRVEGQKLRARAESFFDHFTQARLFFRSQSLPEKRHLIQALRFELGKVERRAIRERMLGVLSYVDRALAESVAAGLGMPVPARLDGPLNQSVPAGGNVAEHQPMEPREDGLDSPALSMLRTKVESARTRKVAILASDGVNGEDVKALRVALLREGARAAIVAPRLGEIVTASGDTLIADFSLLTVGSVLFDAVFVPGGERSVAALVAEPRALRFLDEAWGHAKAIGITGGGAELLEMCGRETPAPGVVVAGAVTKEVATAFIAAVAAHRHFEREEPPPGPEVAVTETTQAAAAGPSR